MKGKFYSVILLGGLTLLGGRADAAFFVHTTNVSSQITGYTNSISIPKFDPTGPSPLIGIQFIISGTTTGTNRYENLGSDTPANITIDFSVELDLLRPDSTSILTVDSVYSTNFVTGTSDGILDFGGASGDTFTDMVGSGTNTTTSVSTNDFALFSGTGTIDLDVVALDNSSASSSKGTLIYQSFPMAGATITVIYQTAVLPEPSVLAFMLSSFGILHVVRQKRLVYRLLHSDQ